MLSLLALFFPAVAMGFLLALAPTGAASLPRWSPSSWPTQLWVIAVAGTVATIGGLLDWIYHRRGGRRVGAAERRVELLALGLGVPLFGLMVGASVMSAPSTLLLPIVGVALVMAGLIVHDETRFHRACSTWETLLHRLLVGGNGIAFVAWLHWCFCRGPLGA